MIPPLVHPAAPPIQNDTPRSFLERGVSVPFTTPMLAGARLRRRLPSVARSSELAMLGNPGAAQPVSSAGGSGERTKPGLEVVVPNPSGRRGVYVLQWSNIGSLCRPTMHDVYLCDVLARHGDPSLPLTPSVLRGAARETALRGVAGRAAAQAAEAAVQLQAAQLAATRRALLLEVIRQTEPPATPPLSGQDGDAAVEARGRAGLTQIADGMGAPSARLEALLETMAECLADLGVGEAIARARVPLLLSAVGELRHDLLTMTDQHEGDAFEQAGGHAAAQIASAAEIAIGMAQVPFAAMRARIACLPSLLSDWLSRQAEFRGLAERAAWILDGWDHVCLLWQSAQARRDRAMTLQEMLVQLPTLPDEAEIWLGLPAGTTGRLNGRVAQHGVVWRNEATLQDRIARNEQLRAMAS